MDLKAKINKLHKSVEDHEGKAKDESIECGKLLCEAKKQYASHGQWKPWLEEHFKGSVRTAQRYMRLYDDSKDDNPPKNVTVSFLTKLTRRLDNTLKEPPSVEDLSVDDQKALRGSLTALRNRIDEAFAKMELEDEAEADDDWNDDD